MPGRGGYPRAGRGHGVPQRSNYGRGYPRGNTSVTRVFGLSALSTNKNGTALKDTARQIYLNGWEYTALIDTGASLNYIRAEVVKKLGLTWNPNETAEISLADTSTTPALGTVEINVELN